MFPKSSGYRRTGNLIQIFDKDLAQYLGFQTVLAGDVEDVGDNRSESGAAQFVATFKLTPSPAHTLKVSELVFNCGCQRQYRGPSRHMGL